MQGDLQLPGLIFHSGGRGVRGALPTKNAHFSSGLVAFPFRNPRALPTGEKFRLCGKVALAEEP